MGIYYRNGLPWLCRLRSPTFAFWKLDNQEWQWYDLVQCPETNGMKSGVGGETKTNKQTKNVWISENWRSKKLEGHWCKSLFEDLSIRNADVQGVKRMDVLAQRERKKLFALLHFFHSILWLSWFDNAHSHWCGHFFLTQFTDSIVHLFWKCSHWSACQ